MRNKQDGEERNRTQSTQRRIFNRGNGRMSWLRPIVIWARHQSARVKNTTRFVRCSCFFSRTSSRCCTILAFVLAFAIYLLIGRQWCDDAYFVKEGRSALSSSGGKQVLLQMSDPTLMNEKLCEILLDKIDADTVQFLRNDDIKYWEAKSRARAASNSGNQTNAASSNDKVTVVTGYFSIGPFCKTRFDVFDTELYLNWMAAYARLLNPVIFYTDHVEAARRFMALRARTPLLRSRTRICVLRRSSLWPFQLLPYIARVLAREDYPKYMPNTVLPEYGAVQHAKYALMRLAINSNPFKTKYFSWFDVGLFRLLVENDAADYQFDASAEAMRSIIAEVENSRCNQVHRPPAVGPTSSNDNLLINSNQHSSTALDCAEISEKQLVHLGFFEAVLPPGFDSKRVAYNKAQHGRAQLHLDVGEYFKRNLVLLGGGAFVGERSVLTEWLSEYEKFVRLLLTLGWSSTDQQVLYAMQSDKLRPMRNGSLRVQVYAPPRFVDPMCWFYLPLLMRQTHIDRVLYNRVLIHNEQELEAVSRFTDLFASPSTVSAARVSEASASKPENSPSSEFDPSSFPLPVKYWPRYYKSVLSEWLSQHIH